MRLDIVDSEAIIKEAPVIFYRNDGLYDGQLYLTNIRICCIGWHGEYWSYTLDKILSIKQYLSFLTKKGIILEFSDGRKEKIQVYKGEDWMMQIISAKLLYSIDQPFQKRDVRVAFDEEKKTLLQNLMKFFNYSELVDLCHYLGIDYENIAGDNKEAKARELISYCERTGRLQELLYRCQTLRPTIRWLVNR